jgi:hypothetical protein
MKAAIGYAPWCGWSEGRLTANAGPGSMHHRGRTGRAGSSARISLRRADRTASGTSNARAPTAFEPAGWSATAPASRGTRRELARSDHRDAASNVAERLLASLSFHAAPLGIACASPASTSVSAGATTREPPVLWQCRATDRPASRHSLGYDCKRRARGRGSRRRVEVVDSKRLAGVDEGAGHRRREDERFNLKFLISR